MFIEHFQMTAHPFSENPPDEWLLIDERFEQALARLKFFQEQGNLSLIIGQTGIGKSSLLNLFKKQLPRNRYDFVFVRHTNVSPYAFLRMVVTKLGEAPRLGKDRLFHQINERIKNNETNTLLIVDEAHLISSKSLTDLRLLISSSQEENLQLKIVLSGQESLSTVLKRSVHADLVNRISVRFRLNPFNKSQTVSYIDHRLRCAGGSEKLFYSEAKVLIHDYAGGIARLINNIATACLINGASKNLQVIDESIVNETMAEFKLS